MCLTGFGLGWGTNAGLGVRKHLFVRPLVLGDTAINRVHMESLALLPFLLALKQHSQNIVPFPGEFVVCLFSGTLHPPLPET